jgi:DNA-binding NarL/FixJ family response regulator
VTSVLLVDDDDELRLLLRVTLSDQGFDIVGEARDGLEAVEHASRLQPDLILLDLSMPTMDGFTALPLLAAVASGSPVVVISAQGDDDIPARLAALGARAFVRKPTTTTYLAAVLTRVHNGGPVGNAVTAG